MKTYTRIAVIMALIVTGSLAFPRTVAAATTLTAPTPITIDGIVFDKKHKPVPGLTVVAWCGGVNFFGGSGVTDANGHYVIKTDSDACPFDNELTLTTDVDGDGLSDGARHTQVFPKTTVNVYLGEYTSIIIPEYGWLGGGVAALASVGIIGYMRRARFGKLAQ